MSDVMNSQWKYKSSLFCLLLFLALAAFKYRQGRSPGNSAISNSDVLEIQKYNLSKAAIFIECYRNNNGGPPSPIPSIEKLAESPLPKFSGRQEELTFGFLHLDSFHKYSGYYPHFFEEEELCIDFHPNGTRPFRYVVWKWQAAIVSQGPDGDDDELWKSLRIDKNNQFELWNIDSLYDPTNGTNSSGDLYISEKFRKFYVKIP